jgi:hypothetical protein
MGAIVRTAFAFAACLLMVSCDGASKELSSLRSTAASKASAAANALAPAPPPDPEAVEREKAIALAKEARTLVAGRAYVKLPPAETLTNEFQIRHEMSTIKGDLTILGWSATKWGPDTYLVTYTFEHQGQSRGWPFEVKVSAGVVRSVLGDSELESKYDWGKRP